MRIALGFTLLVATIAGMCALYIGDPLGVSTNRGGWPERKSAAHEQHLLRAGAEGAWRQSSPTDTTVEPPVTVVVTVPGRKGSGAPPLNVEPWGNPQQATLVRAVQHELKRVGCYDGEINGMWTTSTRQAMKAFTDHVNASLPTKEPDAVLLALVQGHQQIGCSTSSAEGGVRQGSRLTTTAATTSGLPPSSLAEDRMGLAGPKVQVDKPMPERGSRRSEQRRNISNDWQTELWKRQGF